MVYRMIGFSPSFHPDSSPTSYFLFRRLVCCIIAVLTHAHKLQETMREGQGEVAKNDHSLKQNQTMELEMKLWMTGFPFIHFPHMVALVKCTEKTALKTARKAQMWRGTRLETVTLTF